MGCTNCHDPADRMRLTLTSVPLKEALARQGRDWREASRDEMRSLVCAQCHVEYYFETGEHGVAAKPHLPWAKGMNPEDIYRFAACHERYMEAAEFCMACHELGHVLSVRAQRDR